MLIPFAAVLIIALERKATFNYIAKRSVLYSSTLAILLLPWALTARMFSSGYDPTSITGGNFRPSQQMRPMMEYFLPRAVNWLMDWGTMDTQIGLTLWLFGLTAILGSIYLGVMRKWNISHYHKIVLTFSISLLSIYFFLQTKSALFLYEGLSMLEVIQFPWRLLTMIVPLLILVFVVLLAQLEDALTVPKKYTTQIHGVSGAFSFLLILACAVGGFSPYLHAPQNNYFTKDQINKPSNDRGIQNQVFGIGEYSPVYSIDGHIAGPKEKLSQYEGGFKDSKVCNSKEVLRTPKHLLVDVACARDTTLALPYNYSKLTTVYANGNKINLHRTSDDPRIHIDVKSGITKLEIKLPTYSQVFKSLLE